ncbi:class I SAM-dependent methyltransferase [Streptomyces aurantiacus]|uniref:Putative tRNA (Mo5U34)-methyltransferase n=1 Tax=Streptomyces aurantiacus JA 4570 TaxID=1286094 RepID=S3ZSG1_9ACTN|nr:class I SAM-dependent methyltransferase [Streptomyces aurantiacus]EPH46078.1 putative tRNA (mo5U34)-methyltransferase [Streptomyces aurantiacus JA 4570]
MVCETTDAEREVADLMPIEAPVADCQEVLRRVPFWFHTFALNKAAGIYTPGMVRDHRYRIPYLPADFNGLRVLDAGTCDGFYAYLAESRGAERVLAVDNHQCLRLARERFGVDLTGGEAFRAIGALLGSRVEYRRADVLELAGSAEHFDFVYCCGMLHRVENPLGVLRVLRGLLDTGGRILLETYGATGPEAALPTVHVMAAGEANTGDNVHYWGLSAPALTRLARWAALEECGDTQVHTVDGHPRLIATLRAV